MKISKIAFALMAAFGLASAVSAASIREAASARSEADFKNLAGKEWKTVAPGVYRAEESGAVYRVGYGTGGMAFDRAAMADELHEAKAKQLYALDKASAKELRERIAYLEQAITDLDQELAEVSAKASTMHWHRTDSTTCGVTVDYVSDGQLFIGGSPYFQGGMTAGVNINPDGFGGGTGNCTYGVWGWAKAQNDTSSKQVYIKNPSGTTATLSNPAKIYTVGSVTSEQAVTPAAGASCMLSSSVTVKSLSSDPYYAYGYGQYGYRSFTVNQSCETIINSP